MQVLVTKTLDRVNNNRRQTDTFIINVFTINVVFKTKKIIPEKLSEKLTRLTAWLFLKIKRFLFNKKIAFFPKTKLEKLLNFYLLFIFSI